MKYLVSLALCSFMLINLEAQEHNREIGDFRVRETQGIFQEYCREYGTNVEWNINEKHNIMCFECECSAANRGILCKGVGYQDAAVPPQGCMKRRLQDFEMQPGEKCCYQMVNSSNQGTTCGPKVCA